jgi:hypothetical protein
MVEKMTDVEQQEIGSILVHDDGVLRLVARVCAVWPLLLPTRYAWRKCDVMPNLVDYLPDCSVQKGRTA